MTDIFIVTGAVAFIVTALETYVTPLGAWKAPAAVLLAVVGLLFFGGLGAASIVQALFISYFALMLVAVGQRLATPQQVTSRRPAKDWLPPLR